MKKAEALHAQAGMPRECKQAQVEKMRLEQMPSLRQAFQASSLSVVSFKRLPDATRDNYLYGEVLLLDANLAARLAMIMLHNESKARKARIRRATKNVQEADTIFKELKHSHVNVGKVYRVYGMIEMSKNNFKEAKKYFLQSINQFKKIDDYKHESPWFAVAYWCMHLAHMELDEKQESLPWLKKAIVLREMAESDKHPYAKKYRALLKELLKELSLESIGQDDEITLSDEENQFMKSSLASVGSEEAPSS